VEKNRDELAHELQQMKQDHVAALKLAEAELAANEITQRLAINEAVSAVEKERDELKNGLQQATLEKQLAETALKDKYETQIKDRDDAIERLRDMKARLSTKMVGETLELHCETEFNRIRSTAFPRAYFGTARPSSTAFDRPRFREPILRRTTTRARAVRAITFFATRTRRVPRSSRSCLK
jgi:hypothetical protein